MVSKYLSQSYLDLFEQTQEPKYLCPKFDFCGVNKCPLDFRFKELQTAEDEMTKCPLPKRLRLKFGTSLAWKGLNSRELKWLEMSPEAKQSKIENLKKNSPISRLNSKGHIIILKKKDAPKNTQIKGEIHQNSSIEIATSEKNEGLQ